MANKEPLTHTLTGRVISDKRTATRTVEVEWSRRHERYGKVQRGQSVYHVNDPNQESKTGDKVLIKEVRPISKTVSWQLVSVLERSE